MLNDALWKVVQSGDDAAIFDILRESDPVRRANAEYRLRERNPAAWQLYLTLRAEDLDWPSVIDTWLPQLQARRDDLADAMAELYRGLSDSYDWPAGLSRAVNVDVDPRVLAALLEPDPARRKARVQEVLSNADTRTVLGQLLALGWGNIASRSDAASLIEPVREAFGRLKDMITSIHADPSLRRRALDDADQHALAALREPDQFRRLILELDLRINDPVAAVRFRELSGRKWPRWPELTAEGAGELVARYRATQQRVAEAEADLRAAMARVRSDPRFARYLATVNNDEELAQLLHRAAEHMVSDWRLVSNFPFAKVLDNGNRLVTELVTTGEFKNSWQTRDAGRGPLTATPAVVPSKNTWATPRRWVA
ncbi:hypothetical protein [Saccharopolyspora thermophila]|nr:hypothetical protein [Saccharopolyspora subtropica]